MVKLSEIIKSYESVMENEHLLPSVKENGLGTLKVLKEVEDTYGEMVTHDEEFLRYDGEEEFPVDETEPNYCPCCHEELTPLDVFYKGSTVKGVFFIDEEFNEEGIGEDYVDMEESFNKLSAYTCKSCLFTGLDMNQEGTDDGRLVGAVLISINNVRGEKK